MAQEQPLHFPCLFPIKVMGLNKPSFATAVSEIFAAHVGCTEVHYSRRESSGRKYLSITATFTARSKEQLDAIYRELKEHELVLVVL